MTHPGGRPSKFTPERRQAIINDISKYVPYEIAAVANGVCERVLYDWLEQGRNDLAADINSDFSQFVQDIKRAEATRIKENAATLHDREEGWQSKAWLLERRHWKYFSNNAPLVELNKRLDELEAVKKDKDNG